MKEDAGSFASLNQAHKPHSLWSPRQLATTSSGFHIETKWLVKTYNFDVDNKPFRSRMWSKVVESGEYGSGRGRK